MNIFSHPISKVNIAANSTANPAQAGCIGRVGHSEPKLLVYVLASLRTQDWAHVDRTIGFAINGRTNTGRLMV